MSNSSLILWSAKGLLALGAALQWGAAKRYASEQDTRYMYGQLDKDVRLWLGGAVCCVALLVLFVI